MMNLMGRSHAGNDELPVLMMTGDLSQPESEVVYLPESSERPERLVEVNATGWTSHWNYYLHLVDPNFATTNVGLDGVDEVWLSGPISMMWLTNAVGEPSDALAWVIADLREKLDLPVADLAAMCGVKRRQLYNLLGGRTPQAARERLVRALHRVVTDIDKAVGGDRGKVRAAALLPTGTKGETLYSVACAQDQAAIKRIGRELAERLDNGSVRGMIPRPSPRLRGLVSGERAAELLHDQHDPGDVGRAPS